MLDAAPRSGEASLIPLHRRDFQLALLLAGVFALLSASRVYVGVCGQFHDDAIYVITAKSLAEGDGYRLTNLPGEPPQTKYPPLYPALLALLWKLWPEFPANLLLLQGFTVLCGMAFVALSYLYLVRFDHASRAVAFSAVLLCSCFHSMVFFAVITMSETLFAVSLLALLWWLELALRRPDPRPLADLGGGILLVLPFLSRSIGLIFVPLGLALLWQRGKRWRWAFAGAVLGMAPWFAWSLVAANESRHDPVQGYYTDYLGWWANFGFKGLGRVVTFNFLWIQTALASPLLDGLTWRLRTDGHFGLWVLLNVPVGLVVMVVLARELFRGRILATFLGVYLLVVCVWPWLPLRFIMPILPLTTAYLCRGLLGLGRWLFGNPSAPPVLSPSGKPQLNWGGICLFVICLGATVGEHFRQSIIRHQVGTPNPERVRNLHSWSSTARLLDWIQNNTRPDDIIASGVDPTISLYTGRKSYNPLLCDPLAFYYGFEYPRQQLHGLAWKTLERHRPRYLAMTANFHNEEEYLDWIAELEQSQPGFLRVIYQDEEDPRFRVYEFRYNSSLVSVP